MRPDGFSFDDVRVDMRAARVLKSDAPVDLEPKAFEVLCFLVQNPGRLIEKRELLDAVWGETSVTENAMTRVVAQLRRALGDQAREARYVETVPTRGYRFIAEVTPLDPRGGRPSRLRGPVIAVALAVGVAAGIAFALLFRSSPEVARPEPRRLSIVLEDLRLNSPHEPVLDLAPDGRTLAFVARERDAASSMIYLRRLDSGTLTPLPGTEDAHAPFYSPDSQWIGFRQGLELVKVHVDGGPPMPIGKISKGALRTFSAALDVDGSVVFSDCDRLVRLSPSGEEEIIARADSEAGEVASIWPSLLPERRGVIVTVATGTGPTDRHIDVIDGRTGTRRTILASGSGATYVPSGHLVFLWSGSLHAVPFDIESLSMTGSTTTLMDNVITDPMKSLAHVAVSQEGTLVFLPPAEGVEPTLKWLTRNGASLPALDADMEYREPNIAPDGKRIAFRDTRRSSSDIWIYDIESEDLSRVGLDDSPAAISWAPDGEGFAFASRVDGVWNVFITRLTSAGGTAPLLPSSRNQFPKSWSADGSLLAFETETAYANRDIWLMRTDGDPAASPFLDNPHDEREPSFSPDGGWLAYQSNRTGRYEVFVVPLNDPSRQSQVSTDGGREPRWAKGGAEIIFRNGTELMAVEASGTDELRFGYPEVVAQNDSLHPCPGYRNYDVTRDGERFLIVDFEGAPAQTRVEVLLNWPSLLAPARD